MKRHAPRPRVDGKAPHTGTILTSAVVVGLAVHLAGTPAERGKYLVTIVGCNGCHTALIMSPRGPEPDTANLTPHEVRGMGIWTEEGSK